MKRIMLIVCAVLFLACGGGVDVPATSAASSTSSGGGATACDVDAGLSPECLNVAGAPLPDGTACSCGACVVGRCTVTQ